MDLFSEQIISAPLGGSYQDRVDYGHEEIAHSDGDETSQEQPLASCPFHQEELERKQTAVWSITDRAFIHAAKLFKDDKTFICRPTCTDQTADGEQPV